MQYTLILNKLNLFSINLFSSCMISITMIYQLHILQNSCTLVIRNLVITAVHINLNRLSKS